MRLCFSTAFFVLLLYDHLLLIAWAFTIPGTTFFPACCHHRSVLAPHSSREGQEKAIRTKRRATVFRVSKIVDVEQRDALVIPSIEGIDDDLEHRNGIHKLIQTLQDQIPTLLSIPLTPQSAARTYSSNVRLLLVDEKSELASSRDELINLVQAFDLVLSTSTRAGSFLTNSVSKVPPTPPMVQCRLGLNQTLETIQVEWQTDFTSLLLAPSKLEGRSLLEVDSDTQKVAVHRLLEVRWNGQEQDAASIGRFLSTSRQAVLSLQQAPFLQPFLSSPILTQVRDEWIQQQQISPSDSNRTDAPVFVVTGNATDDPSSWTPVDDFYTVRGNYDATNQTIPFPGSKRWTAYAAMHQTIVTFCKQVVPALSGQHSTAKKLKSYFLPQARLYARDGSLLLQGASRLANFYHSLAIWRERSFGSWTCQRIQVLSPSGTTPQIQIDYKTSNQIPGSGAPLQAYGCDVYTLAPVDQGKEDPSSGAAMIEKVEQSKFVIGNGEGQQDGVWLMRSLATAIETGRFQADDDSTSFWIDLLQRFSTTSSAKNEKSKPKVKPPNFPRRPDREALIVYRIMEALHMELRNLVDPASPSTEPPASSFLSENVKLIGYLEETLLRGLTAYSRSVVLAMASLRAGIQSGGIVWEKDPSVQVGLTDKGNVQCSLTLYLRLKAPLTNLPGIKELNGTGFPLRLQLISEYVLCPEEGMILKHRLLETRVNGQLTPGDVVSGWIQRFSGGTSSSSGTEELSEQWLQAIRDTTTWFRSLSGGE